MEVNNPVVPIERRLTKHGNSVAIVVPKHVRELFGWSDTQLLEVPFHLFKKMDKKNKHLLTEANK